MSMYLVNGSDLASIATAIRTKGGTSADLAFPQGFIDAINAIDGGGGSLPSDYEQVDYIQSDGNAYLNTGVQIQDAENSNVFIQYEFASTIYHAGIFGNTKGDLNFEIRYGGRVYMRFGSVSTSYPSVLDAVATTLNVIHTATNNTEGKPIVDTTVNDTPERNTNQSPKSDLYLFCERDSSTGDPTEIVSGLRVYQFKVYEGSQLVWDGVPCVRVTDDEPGMYDMVSRTFFMNANATGGFVVPTT